MSPNHRSPLRFLGQAAVAASFAFSTAACSSFQRPVIPGQTDTQISEVTFQKGLALDYSLLLELLALRTGDFIKPGQPYNPYRQAEDRRRVRAFWQNFGYFDVDVDKAQVSFSEDKRSAKVHWTLNEGTRYRLRSLEIQGAPPEHLAALKEAIPFSLDTPVDIQTFRVVRHTLADVVRKRSHLRSEVYSRAFIDRDAKQIDWVFYVDAGPKNHVGHITVTGARKISHEAIVERAGYQSGDLLDLDTLRRRELDLMDTGAFASARIFVDTGVEFETGATPYESWIPPDTGGNLKPDQVNEDGVFTPRTNLSPEVNVTIAVTEAPTTQGAVRLGASIDHERIDPQAGFKLTWRNALGELNHLVAQADIGYGIRWRGDVDEPLGLYGGAKLQWLRPGLIGRTGDVRLTAAFDEILYPGYHWRTGTVGLGLRTLLDTGLFFDIEPRLRWDDAVGVGQIDDATREGMDLAPIQSSLSGEARLSLVWDTRFDPVEALTGHMLAFRLGIAPVGDFTWLRGEVDFRLFVPFNINMGLGFRASAGMVGSLDGEGVPMGVRLFGGGAWGMRGFGTKRLSLYGERCHDAKCQSIPMGATSMAEASLEFRWLPFRKQVGAVLFGDLGAVSSDLNPFGGAIEGAVGAGLRVRLWHFPIGLDVAWRFTDDAQFKHIDALDQVLVFLRIGEAF